MTAEEYSHCKQVPVPQRDIAKIKTISFTIYKVYEKYIP